MAKSYSKFLNVVDMPFRASTRKRHILVDTLGLIMVREGAKLIFKAFTGSCKKIRRIWVDSGYSGNPLIGTGR